MADAKLSAFPVATVVNAPDFVPILQAGANKLATIGQLKTFATALTNSAITASAVPLTNNVTAVAGVCTLANAASTISIVLVATASGSITFTGGAYNFTAGNAISLVWYTNTWFVVSNQGMTAI